MARNPRFRAPIRDDVSPFSAIYLADGAAGAGTLLASLAKGPGAPTPAASQAPAGPAALTGTSGNDTLVGQADQYDFIEGLAGNDVIDGRGGTDDLDGGPGDDIFYGYVIVTAILGSGLKFAYDHIVERPGEGYDTVYVTGAYFNLSDGAEVELIAMADPNATKCLWIGGNEFDNRIVGDAGNNSINGSGGADTMVGLGGNDDYVVYEFGDVVVEEAGGGSDSILTNITYTLPENVEILGTGGGGEHIDLTGNSLDNSVSGNQGANVIDGKGGMDQLRGRGGADIFAFTTALGPANIDTITDFSRSLDRISLLGGTGGPFAALEPTFLFANAFVRGTEATAAEHRIIYDPANGRLYYDADGVGGAGAIQFATLSNAPAIEAWHFIVAAAPGDPDDDVLIGSDGVNDMLAGLAGDDVLDGRGGTDTTDGGTGNDLHYVNGPGDVVIERDGEGRDRIVASGHYVLAANAFVEEMVALPGSAPGTRSVNLTGNDLDNYLIGNDGDNILSGGGGNDNLNGGDGHDRLSGGGGDDHLIGGGAPSQDWLDGGTGADVMAGGLADDTYWVDETGDQVIEVAGEGVYDTLFIGYSFVLPSALSIEIIYLTGPRLAHFDLTGNELGQMLVGSDGNNRLDGGSGGADSLYGLDGDDSYYVTSTMVVREYVNNGFDRIYARTSFTLLAGNYVEVLSTADDAGTAAIDLTGNSFDNILYGNAGNNVLDGAGGADTMTGYGGDDSYYVDSAADRTIEIAGGGNDRVFASFHYTLEAGTHVEILSTADDAGTAAINLTGNELDNIIYGNAGNNVLDGKAGIDAMTGRLGNDSYYVDSLADQVIEAAGEGQDRILSSIHYALAAGHSIEVLSTANDSGTGTINLTGNELDNIIYGNAGNNTLTGGAGNDFLFGYLGVNVLVGGLGDDSYHVGYGSDAVTENAGEGQDRILARADFTLAAGASIEILSTDFNAGTDAINLGGNELDNIIYGNAGNNILYGKGGNDWLEGLGGNDGYFVDTAGDYVREVAGGGNDRIFASADYTLYTGQEIEILSTDNNAGTAAINLGGNELNNIIYGNAGANILYGKGGNDWLEGLSGDDSYYIDSAGDYVREVAGGGSDRIFAGGDYTLYAGQEIEILSTDHNAGTASIALGGNELDNTIYGNDGNNILYGKEGNDTLLGLGGNDQFWFNTTLGAANVDTIYGFASGSDKLVLFQSVFAGLSSGGLPASAFVTGSAAADADDRIVYNNATGALLYDADGNGAGAAVQFATLNGAPPIVASDFLVI